MSRLYEVMFIVRPDVAEEDADKLIAGFSATVTGGGGVVKTVEKMGRRKLAYTVRKFNDGNYVLLTIEANGAVVLELERRLRVTEPVIKFITVRIDEEEKRLAKVRLCAAFGASANPEPSRLQPQQRRRQLPSRGGSCRAGSGRRLASCQTNRRCRPFVQGHRLRPDPAFRGSCNGAGGTEESEEETACLKRLKQRRRKRAPHRKPRLHRSRASSGPGPGSGSASSHRRTARRTRRTALGGPGGRGKFFRRKKVCKFCTEKIDAIPYRDVRLLQGFVAERGKIVPRRLTGVCTTHQRRLTRAIKQARNIALLPFATRH